MTEYDNLRSLYGPLKRAAIDAFMCSTTDSPNGWKIAGDKYESFTIDMMGGAAYRDTVTRPGPDGEGGGIFESQVLGGRTDTQAYIENFNKVRTRIDDALKNLDWFPDPGDIAPLCANMRAANTKLAFGAINNDGTVSGGGSIAGNINLIFENSTAMAGGMITAYKANFLAQLGRTVGGHHALTVVLGAALASQEKMWEHARAGVVDTVQQSTSAFNAAAEQGSNPDWNLILKVAGWVAAGAAVFATGGASIAVKVVNLGLTITTASLPEGAQVQHPAGTYDSIIATFESALQKIRDDITSEESALRTNLQTNFNRVRENTGAYDLSRPPMMDVTDGADLGTIEIKRILVDEITGTYMPNIATELFHAQSDVAGSLGYNGEAFFRAADVGIGSYGPLTEYFNLFMDLRDLIGNLAEEVKYSAEMLDRALTDFERQDASSQSALDGKRGEIHQVEAAHAGSGYNIPFDR